MRTRRAAIASAAIIAAHSTAMSPVPAKAKTPGEVHCYKDVCHRVKSLDAMARLVGREFFEHASFYDIPERDRMNIGTLTSSGEFFDAWSDSHAASSTYPDGTELLLWNPENGRTSHVRVNDFGPFYKRRTLDVTRGVAEKLDFARLGVTTLKVFVIWAPDPRSARYRRQRIYPPVEGYLGRFDYDQLTPLKNRLIAQALPRNGQPPLPALFAGAPSSAATTVDAANTPASHSLDALPAFAHPQGDDAERAAAEAQFLNTPRYALSAVPPARTFDASVPFAFASATGPNALESTTTPRAFVTTSMPPLIVASDAEWAVAASLDGSLQSAAVSMSAALPAAETESSVTMAGAALTRILRAAAVGPNNVMWQHLLLALGLLSAAAATWRTRQLINRSRRTVATAAASARRVPPLPKTANDMAPFTTLTYGGSLQLPPLPLHQHQKSDDVLRAEVARLLGTFEYRAAELVLRQLLARRERDHGIDHPLTASAERQLADCLRDQGRYAAAEPYYRRALVTMKSAAGGLHPAVGDVLDEYALCLIRQGRASDARGLALQSLTVRRLTAVSAREYAVTRTIIAEAQRALGNLDEAEAGHRDAWSRFVALSGETSLDAAASMMSLGAVMVESGRFPAAEELLNASARVITAACGNGHPASATVYATLGDLYLRAGQFAAATEMYGYAVTIREQVYGGRHPDTIESQLALAITATGRLDMDEARSWLGRALSGLALGEHCELGPQSRIHHQLTELSGHLDTSIAYTAVAAE